MIDEDLIDSTWRDGLRELALDGERADAPARVAQRMRRHRRRRYVAVSSLAAALVVTVAGATIVAVGDDGAPSTPASSPTGDSSPPTTEPPQIGAPPRVDVTLTECYGGDVVLTSGGSTFTPAIPIVPGLADVIWDGAHGRGCPRYQSDEHATLELPDGRRLAVGSSATVAIPSSRPYFLRVHANGHVVATGELGVKEPSVDRHTPPSESIVITAHEDEPLCGYDVGQPGSPSLDSLELTAATYRFTVRNSRGRGPFVFSSGSWSQPVADGTSVALDLPVGHYVVTCPGGGTVPIFVGG